MVKEGGSNVIKVSEEGEEAASQFVVPHLVKTGIFTQCTTHNNTKQTIKHGQRVCLLI